MGKRVVYVEGEPTDEEIDQIIDELFGSTVEEAEADRKPDDPGEEE